MNTTEDNVTTSDPAVLFLTPLLASHPLSGPLYVFLTLVAILSGVFGNILTIVVHLVTKELCKKEHRGNQRLIINMAVADLFVVAIADPMCLVGAIGGEEFLAARPILCTAIGSLCLTACICALLSLTFLTVYRYFYLVHKARCVQIFSNWPGLVLCSSLWVVAALLEMPSFFGWGGHSFDVKNHSCAWDRAASYSYTAFVTAALVGGPMGLMGIIYSKIGWMISKAKMAVTSHSQANKHTAAHIWKATRPLFLIFVTYIVCWTPYCLVLLVDRHDTMSVPLYLWVTWLAHTHSAVTWIVHLVTNNAFKLGVCQLIHRPMHAATPANTIGPVDQAGSNDPQPAIVASSGISDPPSLTVGEHNATGLHMETLILPTDTGCFKIIGLSPNNGPRI